MTAVEPVAGDDEAVTAPYQLFDALEPETDSALRASIEHFGEVLVPIVVDQHGNVIDGHHRKAIADELGIVPRVDVRHVADDDEARALAVTLNADRRQLDPEQRRDAVAALREQSHSVRAIAAALGVPKSTVQDDIKQLSDAGQLNPPERVTGLDGRARPARRPVVAAKSPREAERAQVALQALGDAVPGRVLDVKRAERLARERQAELRRLIEPEPVALVDGIDLRYGDFREVLGDIEAGSVDAVIVDPPYGREFIDSGGLEDLGELAARVLKPTGNLALMFGNAFADRVIVRLDANPNLHYRGFIVWRQPGAHAYVNSLKTSPTCKPVLLYDKGQRDRWLSDDYIESTGREKAGHEWQQNAEGFRRLVELLTRPGELVVDPCLGAGTTAIACRDLGRRFIGCDIDAAAVHTSRERVA